MLSSTFFFFSWNWIKPWNSTYFLSSQILFSNLLSKENILLWSFMANLANQRLACSSSTYYIVVNKYMNFSIKGLYASALITWNLTCSFITWIGNFSENRKREPIYIYIYIWGITYGMNGYNWAMCTTMKILGVGGMAKR